MKRILTLFGVALFLFSITLVQSCKKDKEDDVIASFTYTVDAGNFKLIHFTNASTGFSTLSWNFGDGSAVSFETNPNHTYADLGEYTVTLTATSSGGKTDVYTAKVTIADPNAELTKLVGEGTDGKVWKLIRDVSTGRYPMEVGPWDRSSIWWAQGLNNDELANRPCILNDSWTFKRDGSMIYDAAGDYWAEGGYFTPDNICASTSNMVGPNGEDLTAWGNGNHQFKLYPGSNPKISAIGKGAFIGHIKLGNMVETKVPLDSVQYNIVKLYDGAVDTLIIEGQYKWDAGDGGYWRYVLVHYDDPNQEPPIPGNKPSVGFTLSWNGLTVTCNNSTTGATSYLWDFGDGATSGDMNPTHTYAHEGIYNITLTATNSNGSASSSAVAFVTATQITDAILQAGAWKVRVDNLAIFVGSGLGKNDWWSVSKSMLDGSSSGGDDWSCITTDEFIFKAGGEYEYKTNGSTRNDGWFGGSNGCITDAEIAASPNNGPAFGSGIHSYVLTTGNKSGRPVITLTNGASGAAFLGFVKGYNGIASGVKGGENTDNSVAPNFGSATNTYEVMGYANTGTKEYLFVSVDITGDHSGTAAWSIILER